MTLYAHRSVIIRLDSQQLQKLTNSRPDCKPGNAIAIVSRDSIVVVFLALSEKISDREPRIHMVLIHVSMQYPIVLQRQGTHQATLKLEI